MQAVPSFVRRALAGAVVWLAPCAVGAQQALARPLSLGDVVQLAAGQNAAVDVAHARLAQATARIRERRADLLPNLTAAAVQGGRTFNTSTLGFAFAGPDGVPFFDPEGQVVGPVHTVDLRAHLSQSLFDAAALQRVRAARGAADAVGTEADAAAEQAAAAAAMAYVRLLRADAQVAARLADSTLAAELLSIAQDQVRAGVGIALDVTRARAQVSLLHAQGISARQERARAALELARILALPPDRDVVPADSLGDLSLATTEGGDLARALTQRPELRTLDAQLLASAQEAKAIRRERLPSLSAFGDNGPIAGEGGAYLRTYSWGLQLSVGIFDGFRRDARLEEQAASREELEFRRRDVVRQVSLDVRGATDDLAAAREQLDAAHERVSLAEQELAQARERFRAGVSGNAEAITASLGLNAARTLVIDALSAWHAARIALARAQGAARTLR
ncbi:MAG: TolC family protein [Gemmatimonadota bacterium]